MKPIAIVSLLVFVGSIGVESAARAVFFCPDEDYVEFDVNNSHPYSGVGFLSNGCTAFMIDDSHIVAAGHCFRRGYTGEWFDDLRFYPNFHPDLVAADAANVPRATVERAVVGGRVAYGQAPYDGESDWGIAKLVHWRDASPSDYSPLTLLPWSQDDGWYSFPLLEQVDYGRGHFPYDDEDIMERDCGDWLVIRQPAPIDPGYTLGCNSRWAAGSIHQECPNFRIENDVVRHTCDTAGGASGSPLGFAAWGRGFAIAVTSGSSHSFRIGAVDPCASTTNTGAYNTAASAARFDSAPRYASNVAVATREDGARATGLFAVDSDLDRVVYRSRKGSNPNYSSEFGFWDDLGTPVVGAELTRIAACKQYGERPEVFVLADGQLYGRFAGTGGTWSDWESIPLPPGVSSLDDIDATYPLFGSTAYCSLVAASAEGGAFMWPYPQFLRYFGNETFWETIDSRYGYTRITSIKNHDDVVWAAMIGPNGALFRSKRTSSGWAPRQLLRWDAGWVDLDMTWDEWGLGFLLAYRNDDRLDFVQMRGGDSWPGWRHFTTALWAPGADERQSSPTLTSITASRWIEDAPGTTSPVVFGTGDRGNVYFVEYRRSGGTGWVLDWKSFYHERIVY